MIRRAALLLIVFASFGALVVPRSVAAQTDAPGITIDVRAGYGGSYRAGEWFPVVVDLANDGADIRGELEWSFPGQRNEPVFRSTIDLPRGSRKRVALDVFSRSFARNGELRLIENGAILVERSVGLDPIDSDRFVVGVVSSDLSLLNSLNSLQVPNSVGTFVRHITIAELPERAASLRGLNVLFFHDTDTGALTAGQRAAIALWVSLGGQLIVSGGVNQQTPAGLADILPVEIAGGLAEGDLSPLVALATTPLPNRAPAPLNNVVPRAGARQLPADSGLIYMRNLGGGAVVFTRFDIAALRGWGGEIAMWSNVLAPVPLFLPAASARVNQTSLLQNVLQLPALGLPSAGVLMIFLLAYIAIIGPGNYLLLRRFGRLEWAWITVPLTVAIFSIGLYAVGFGLRGGQAQLNQVAVVQGAEGEPHALATAYVGLFSPLRASYTIAFPAGSLVSETRSFDDPPGRAAAVVATDTDVRIADVLIDVASVRTLVSETPVELPLQVESNLTRDANGRVVGEVRSIGGIALESALVVRGTAFQEIGSLGPGGASSFDLGTASRTFPWGVTLPEAGLFNRKQLFSALFSSDAVRFTSPGAGGGAIDAEGVYLLGWAASPSVAVDLNGGGADQNGLTLYVIRLRDA
jgi:hypothetical protein